MVPIEAWAVRFADYVKYPHCVMLSQHADGLKDHTISVGTSRKRESTIFLNLGTIYDSW